MNRNNVLITSVKYLCTPTNTISPNDCVLNVYNVMMSNPNSVGLCIIDNDIPIGIITKEKLALHLSGQYGFTLYQKKPISVLMDRNFLAVDCETSVNIVSSLAMSRPADRLYDFIVVTQDNKYLGTVTIKDLLLKTMEIEVCAAKHQNPLSGLPGNLIIEQKLNQYIESKKKFCIAYLDIDNFKPYNDVYGFENGDSVIKLLADILKENVPCDQFVGHIGGDDFVVMLDEFVTDDFFDNIVLQFEREVLSFYNQSDIKRGHIIAANRRGEIEQFPLITLTYVMINNKMRNFKSAFEIAEILSELKRIVKQNKAVSKHKKTI